MLKMLRKFKFVDGLLLLGIVMVTVGIGMSMRKQNEEKVVLKKGEETTPIKMVDEYIVVDVSGEVMRPGVYKLTKGARVSDGLVSAGGLAAMADREWVDKNINKAKVLMDGEKIYIPKKGDEGMMGVGSGSGEVVVTSRLISINSAGVEELDKLNGVGVAIAQRIIEYRESVGGFKNIEEIKMVPGIGDKMYEKIKNEISL